MERNNRDDFSTEVINISKLQAAYICSNPSCKRLTIAPSLTEEMSVQYCGKVAHITAAASGGPRYNTNISKKERQSISNAIFLCSNCADLIDKNNGVDYKIEALQGWKEKHHEWVIQNLNKSTNDNMTNSINSYNQLGGVIANTININSLLTEKIDENKQHDKQTYLKSETVFNEEQLHRLHSSLFHNAECLIDDSFSLGEMHDFFQKAGNSFINSKIDSAKKEFIKAIPPLTSFIHRHFDKWPYNQGESNFNIKLHPDYLRDTMYKKMNLDDNKKWDKLFIELQKLLAEFYDSYNQFRKVVKYELHV